MDERRTGWVLLFVLAGQLVVLAIQAARSPGESYLETVGLRVLGPVARTVSGMPRNVSEAGEGMKLRAEQRMNFIRAVGEASNVLTHDQHQALVGTMATSKK